MNVTDHTLRISLRHVAPEVWRRITVPSETALDALSRIFEITMGWEGDHLHEFESDGVRFSGDGDVRETDVVLAEVAGAADDEFRWLYDFGDGWEHSIAVESVGEACRKPRSPTCLDGAQGCPPDDCGGPGGYRFLVDVLADPQHDDYEDMLEWAGPDVDPSVFDREALNSRLKYHRPSPARVSASTPTREGGTSRSGVSSLALAWFDRDEWPRAVERWPDLLDDSPEEHRAYCHRLERQIRELASRSGATRFAVSPITVEGLVEHAEEYGDDPGSGLTRADLAALVGLTGAAIAWPPSRNDPCWCGSAMKYKRCCGVVQADLRNPVP